MSDPFIAPEGAVQFELDVPKLRSYAPPGLADTIFDLCEQQGAIWVIPTCMTRPHCGHKVLEVIDTSLHPQILREYRKLAGSTMIIAFCECGGRIIE